MIHRHFLQISSTYLCCVNLKATTMALDSNAPGHLANAAMILSTTLFWLPLLLPEGYPYISSASYKRDGFCINNPADFPLLNSHLLCFYFDTAAAAVFYYLPRSVTRYSGVTKLRTNAVGIFGHGVGHLFLYMQDPLLESSTSFFDLDLLNQVAFLAFSIGFFALFFLSIPPLPKAHVLPLAVVFGVPLNTLIPAQVRVGDKLLLRFQSWYRSNAFNTIFYMNCFACCSCPSPMFRLCCSAPAAFMSAVNAKNPLTTLLTVSLYTSPFPSLAGLRVCDATSGFVLSVGT